MASEEKKSRWEGNKNCVFFLRRRLILSNPRPSISVSRGPQARGSRLRSVATERNIKSKPCVKIAHMFKMTLGPEGIQPEVRMGITE